LGISSQEAAAARTGGAKNSEFTEPDQYIAKACHVMACPERRSKQQHRSPFTIHTAAEAALLPR
jgi:hypothetical protein